MLPYRLLCSKAEGGGRYLSSADNCCTPRVPRIRLGSQKIRLAPTALCTRPMRAKHTTGNLVHRNKTKIMRHTPTTRKLDYGTHHCGCCMHSRFVFLECGVLFGVRDDPQRPAPCFTGQVSHRRRCDFGAALGIHRFWQVACAVAYQILLHPRILDFIAYLPTFILSTSPWLYR